MMKRRPEASGNRELKIENFLQLPMTHFQSSDADFVSKIAGKIGIYFSTGHEHWPPPCRDDTLRLNAAPPTHKMP